MQWNGGGTMTVGEVLEVARDWVATKLPENPGVQAVYVAGSLNRLSPEQPMPDSSDVDIHVVQGSRGSWRTDGLYRGVLLQCSVNSIDLGDAAAVLAHPYEGHPLLFGRARADPHGVLASMRRAARAHFAEHRWVVARCEVALRSANEWLDMLDRQQGGQLQWASALIAWAVASVAATCAVATQRDPGGRKCLVIAREVLLKVRRADLYERLLAGFGVGRLTVERVKAMHAESLELFDRAVALHRTRVPGDDQLREYYRPYVAAGAAEIMDQGLYQEAMWRIHRTYYPAAAVLLADAAEAERGLYGEMWRSVRRDLGLDSEARIRARASELRVLSADVLEAVVAVAVAEDTN